jgi:hypothetical protein
MKFLPGSIKWHIVLTYIDECLVYSNTFDEHVEALETAFSRLTVDGLTLSAKQCHFTTALVRFLGHVVTADVIHQDPLKLVTVREVEMPKDKKGLRSILGLFGYYLKFWKKYSTVVHHLNMEFTNTTKIPNDASGAIM